jgi:hypothetical protein
MKDFFGKNSLYSPLIFFRVFASIKLLPISLLSERMAAVNIALNRRYIAFLITLFQGFLSTQQYL